MIPLMTYGRDLSTLIGWKYLKKKKLINYKNLLWNFWKYKYTWKFISWPMHATTHVWSFNITNNFFMIIINFKSWSNDRQFLFNASQKFCGFHRHFLWFKKLNKIYQKLNFFFFFILLHTCNNPGTHPQLKFFIKENPNSPEASFKIISQPRDEPNKYLCHGVEFSIERNSVSAPLTLTLYWFPYWPSTDQ